jgi:hypothetical protein
MPVITQRTYHIAIVVRETRASRCDANRLTLAMRAGPPTTPCRFTSFPPTELVTAPAEFVSSEARAPQFIRNTVFVRRVRELCEARRAFVARSGTRAPQEAEKRRLATRLDRGTPIAKSTDVVLKRMREAAVTLLVVGMLFAMLILINPRVRESAGQLGGDVQNQHWEASAAPVGNVAASVISMTSYYAPDNPYLFSFLIVAGVLFVLLLRT